MAKGKVEFAVGKMIEFTEDDRREMHALAVQLVAAIERSQPGVAQLIMKEFKIVQRAIARSHAT